MMCNPDSKLGTGPVSIKYSAGIRGHLGHMQGVCQRGMGYGHVKVGVQ